MHRIIATVIVAILAPACATDDPASPPLGDCPVTIPTADFVPPSSYPTVPSTTEAGDVWFGADELFTVLPLDGEYAPRKSVWWSTHFPGGHDEERPPIAVSWTDLADPTRTHHHGPGTNAYTGADGWFMIAGIDPSEPGCWKVEATYEGATLSYVYESR